MPRTVFELIPIIAIRHAARDEEIVIVNGTPVTVAIMPIGRPPMAVNPHMSICIEPIRPRNSSGTSICNRAPTMVMDAPLLIPAPTNSSIDNKTEFDREKDKVSNANISDVSNSSQPLARKWLVAATTIAPISPPTPDAPMSRAKPRSGELSTSDAIAGRNSIYGITSEVTMIPITRTSFNSGCFTA